MASLAFGGGKPESIQASGYLTDTGVDELASIIIKYPGILYINCYHINILPLRFKARGGWSHL